MVYCFAPAKWNGSIAIYQKIIRPFILKYETKIDDIIDRGVQRAKDGLDEGKNGHLIIQCIRYIVGILLFLTTLRGVL